MKKLRNKIIAEYFQPDFYPDQANLTISGESVYDYDANYEFQLIIGNPKYANVFVYLFRRFGNTKFNGDHYKDLVQYILTTPHPEIHLLIHIGSAEDVRLQAIVSDELLGKIGQQIMSPEFEWQKSFKAWALETKGVDVFSFDVLDWFTIYTHESPKKIYISEADNARCAKEFEKWEKEFSPETVDKEVSNKKEVNKIIKRFRDYNQERLKNLIEEYNQIKPRKPLSWASELKSKPYPKDKITKIKAHWRYWSKFPEDSPCGILAKAIRATLCDLRRPVAIRDAYYNLFGLIRNEDELDEFMEVDEREDSETEGELIKDLIAPYTKPN